LTVEAAVDLIGLLYEGPLEASPWCSFLKRARAVFRAEAVTLILRVPSQGNRGLIFGVGGRGPRWESAYAEEFFLMDPFLHLPPDRVFTLDEITTFDEYERSAYYHQFMKPTGNYYVMGVDADSSSGKVIRFRTSRPREAGNFTETARQLCEGLVPHLCRSFRTFDRLAKVQLERDLYEDAIDQMAVAAILLDRECRVVRSSEVANRMLARSEGLWVAEGLLCASTPEQTYRLRELVRRTLEARSLERPAIAQAMAIAPTRRGPGLSLLVRPYERHVWEYDESPAVVEIFVRETPRVGAISRADVRKLFGLTAAEATLSARLAEGARLAELASELGISKHTARNQLQSVFAKVGVRRQADLVRVILRRLEGFAPVSRSR